MDGKRTEYLMQSGRSSLDELTADAKCFQRSVGGADSDALDQYFTSLRAVEKRMEQQLSIINDSVPQPDYKASRLRSDHAEPAEGCGVDLL